MSFSAKGFPEHSPQTSNGLFDRLTPWPRTLAEAVEMYRVGEAERLSLPMPRGESHREQFRDAKFWLSAKSALALIERSEAYGMAIHEALVAGAPSIAAAENKVLLVMHELGLLHEDAERHATAH